MTTLAERFAAQRGRPVDVEGTAVHNIYRRSVKSGEAVTVEFLHAIDVPSQGLRFKLHGGTIVVNGLELSEVVIWRRTAPDVMSLAFRVKKLGQSAELRVWNCWQDSDGITHAWIGNAGMVVTESGQHAKLNCSDGTGEFDPTALEAQLTFVYAQAPTFQGT